MVSRNDGNHMGSFCSKYIHIVNSQGEVVDWRNVLIIGLAMWIGWVVAWHAWMKNSFK